MLSSLIATRMFFGWDGFQSGVEGVMAPRPRAELNIRACVLPLPSFLFNLALPALCPVRFGTVRIIAFVYRTSLYDLQIAKQGRRVDIMHYHHAWNGFYSGTWAQAKAKYSKIMSDHDDVNYVTVLREPVAHYLSYYYYFLNPINKVGMGIRVRCAFVLFGIPSSVSGLYTSGLTYV